MLRLPHFVACLIFSLSLGAQDRTVIQSCDFHRTIKSSSDYTYLTICSETDQNSIELTISGRLTEKDALKVFDGDNIYAPAFAERFKLAPNAPLTVKSSKLCLTVYSKLEDNSFLDLATKCIPIDRAKWPVYQAKGK